MADLTPEEQHFFTSGGDTSKLMPEAPVDDTPPIDPLALSGLGNETPDPVAPVAPVAEVPPIAPVIQPPQPDTTELLRRSLAEAQQQSANLAAQLAQATAPKQPEITAPDPNTDPLGSMLHQLDQVNKNVADLQTRLNEQQMQTQQMAAFQKFQQQIVSLRDAFKIGTPDFDQAYSHLRETRMADLRTFGLPDAEVNKQIFQEEITLSEAALRQGKNPAEAIYEMAKRHGYNGIKEVQPQQTKVGPATATQPQAPASPTPPTNKLAAIKAGIQATPANLPRTPVNEALTPESLREASDADLNRLVTDPAAWAKISGTDHIPL